MNYNTPDDDLVGYGSKQRFSAVVGRHRKENKMSKTVLLKMIEFFEGMAKNEEELGHEQEARYFEGACDAYKAIYRVMWGK